MQLYLLTPDNKLLHYFRSADKEMKTDIIQFRNEDNGFKKAIHNPAAVLFVQWTAVEVPAAVEKLTQRNVHLLEKRLFVYVPDLPEISVNSGTEIRFALLQAGATAVFGSMREIKMQHFF